MTPDTLSHDVQPVPPAAPPALDPYDPAVVKADLELVCRMLAHGGVRDPEVLRRIRERADRVRDRLFRQHGLLNIAVDLIREGRDEE